MPTVAQLLSTRRPATPDSHIIATATITAADGNLDISLPDGTVVEAISPVDLAINAGDVLLVLISSVGNIALARLESAS